MYSSDVTGRICPLTNAFPLPGSPCLVQTCTVQLHQWFYGSDLQQAILKLTNEVSSDLRQGAESRCRSLNRSPCIVVIRCIIISKTLSRLRLAFCRKKKQHWTEIIMYHAEVTFTLWLTPVSAPSSSTIFREILFEWLWGELQKLLKAALWGSFLHNGIWFSGNLAPYWNRFEYVL